MNHSFLSLTGLCIILASCSVGGDRKVDVRIDGAANKPVFFDKFVNNAWVHVDSATLDGDGSARMTVPRLPLDFYRIALSEADQIIVVLDSTESISVEAKVGSLMTPEKVSGSPLSMELHEFYNQARVFEEEREELRRRLSQGNDMSAMDRFNAVQKEYADACRAFIAAHPGSPGTLSAVSKLNMQQDMALFVQVRDQLRTPMAGSGFYRAFRDQVDRMEKQEQARKMQEEQMARLSNLVPVGSPAPNFTQNTPQGKPLSLSDLRGKVVLIDFWASWCKPCRMENPNLVKAYGKYNTKGFEILGVSLDRAHDAWVNAIQQDGLAWPQVSDLQFWNNAAAQTYGVSSIPFSVLVDKEGNIIDKNLRGPALEAKLAEIFGS